MKNKPSSPGTESPAGMKKRVGSIIRRLRSRHPEARTALLHGNPLQLLVATILSAQCTDERVNQVTPRLFSTYRTAADFASADPAELESIIRSTGFYRAKARNIRLCCSEIAGFHGGRVPESMEDLVRLPGVGRKTANVVLGSAFGKAVGVVVDTHVKRISGLLGLTSWSDPEKIEGDLMNVVPKRDWIGFSHLLILHGRSVCRARKPDCAGCTISDLCPSSRV
jgi:endonuclease-3